MLLVLDNFEHLLDGVGLVTQVLASAPEVKLLVTSRTRLQVQAEYPCAVTGMSCPAQELVADAGQYSAIKLFLDSGRRARSDFELTAENAPDVVCICNLVAGMPLGIVLAAGWLEILTPAEIADQISADTGPGLDFLEADLRDLPPRQRSMRAVFDHSWRLLAEREQEVFQGLAVFRGGFSQQGAQAVTGATLRDLKRLVGKSLLQRASARLYEVHELLRQYVEEKLNQQPGVGEAARDRHSEYYTGAVAQWWEDIKGPRQRAALAEMAAEFQNVRAAWDWAAERGRVELLNQALEGLCEFCWQRAWQEGLAACQIAAEKLASMETLEPDGQRVLARIWIRQANYNGYLNHTELAAQQVQQGLKLLDGLERADQDVRRERAYALLTIGGVISANREEREQLYEQSLTLYRAVDDRYWTGFVLFSSSMITDHFSEARQLIGQALEICEDLGSITLATYSVCGLGYIALAEGELEKAERFLRQALPDAQESGSQQAIAFALGPLGITLVCGGRFAEGYALLQENRAVINDLGWSFMVGEAQTGLSLVKMHLGQYDEARLQLPVDYAQGAGNQARSLLALGSLDFALGSLELTEGAYGEAHQLLQEGVAQEREFGRLWYLAGHLAVLGYAARGLGQSSQARQHLVEALEIVTEYGVYLMLVYAFPLAALLLADRDEVERAVEIYALALNYPFVANSKWFEDVAGQHIAAVAATLPPEVVAAAQERGRARDVEATVAELLTEFGD